MNEEQNCFHVQPTSQFIAANLDDESSKVWEQLPWTASSQPVDGITKASFTSHVDGSESYVTTGLVSTVTVMLRFRAQTREVFSVVAVLLGLQFTRPSRRGCKLKDPRKYLQSDKESRSDKQQICSNRL